MATVYELTAPVHVDPNVPVDWINRYEEHLVLASTLAYMKARQQARVGNADVWAQKVDKGFLKIEATLTASLAAVWPSSVTPVADALLAYKRNAVLAHTKMQDKFDASTDAEVYAPKIAVGKNMWAFQAPFITAGNRVMNGIFRLLIGDPGWQEFAGEDWEHTGDPGQFVAAPFWLVANQKPAKQTLFQHGRRGVTKGYKHGTQPLTYVNGQLGILTTIRNVVYAVTSVVELVPNGGTGNIDFHVKIDV